MAKIEALKEEIGLMDRLMTLFIGASILAVGGLLGLYLEDGINNFVAYGFIGVAGLLSVSLYFFVRSLRLIRQLETCDGRD